MLIDDIQIKARAGNGGRGAVAFNSNMLSLGPTGGKGGNGGNIYGEGVSDINALRQFRFKKEIKAEDGRDGRGQFRDGKNGNDLIIKLPVGTTIHNLTNNTTVEIEKMSERALLVKGGLGGRGNFSFRSSRNTSPKESRPGTPGEDFDLRLELKLIADVGLIGLPNAGKSSFLNILTNASSKVANYPFTTLEPSLGVYHDLILGDIPGLIEGSSAGRGLGIKFLRHIERTRTLFHFISAESENPAKDYCIIRKELENYKKELLLKPEYVFLSKSDLIDAREREKKLKELKEVNPNSTAISVYDPQSIKSAEDILRSIQNQKRVS